MTQPRPEQDDVDAWRDFQAVLEERDREWWADAESTDEMRASAPSGVAPGQCEHLAPVNDAIVVGEVAAGA